MLRRLAFVALSILIGSCGGDSGGTSVSRAMGLVTITSPAAGTSSSRAIYRKSRGDVQLFSGTPDNVKPIETMETELAAVRDGNPTEQAAALGNPLLFTSVRAACYGPGWSDDATGGLVSRPTQDLGVAYATASNTDSTACLAAELNALLAGTPSLVNNLVKVQAIMIAAAAASGKALPALGETIDVTSNMPTITGVTVTAASLSRVTNSASEEIYKTLLTVSSGGSSGTITIYHVPLNGDNSNYKGFLQATIPASVGYRGISMIYSNVDSVFSFVFKTAANQASSDSNFFDTTGQVDFSKAAFQQDGNFMLGYFDKTTNEARAHYGWQAGKADASARTFALYIPAGTDGALSGTGYFGFGTDITSLTASNTPWMTKMYCNWLSGFAGGATVAKVQKQTMSQSGGKFIVASNAWEFAPTDSCNAGANWTVSSADASFLNGVHSEGVAANNLVAAPTSSAVPAVTAPTFTLP